MRLGFLLILITATGCLATDPAAWQGGHYNAARAAVYTCEEIVESKTAQAAAWGGVIAPLVALVSRSSEFERCMEARGYRKGE